MDDRLFWALVIIGLLAVTGAIYLLRFLRQRPSTGKREAKANINETAKEALRSLDSKNLVELELVPRKNGDYYRSTDLENAVAAEEALTRINNKSTPS